MASLEYFRRFQPDYDLISPSELKLSARFIQHQHSSSDKQSINIMWWNPCTAKIWENATGRPLHMNSLLALNDKTMETSSELKDESQSSEKKPLASLEKAEHFVHQKKFGNRTMLKCNTWTPEREWNAVQFNQMDLFGSGPRNL